MPAVGSQTLICWAITLFRMAGLTGIIMPPRPTGGLVLCLGKCNYTCIMYSTRANMTCYRLLLKTTKFLPGNNCQIPAANLGIHAVNFYAYSGNRTIGPLWQGKVKINLSHKPSSNSTQYRVPQTVHARSSGGATNRTTDRLTAVNHTNSALHEVL